MKGNEKEDEMSQFSDGEKDSLWADSNELATGLIQSNSNHFIEISDGEDSDLISIISLQECFEALEGGPKSL